jgi:hypothetical protein
MGLFSFIGNKTLCCGVLRGMAVRRGAKRCSVARRVAMMIDQQIFQKVNDIF